MKDSLVTVGRIGKAHGLRGEVSVEAWTDDPEGRFSVGTVFVTGPAAAARPAALTVAGVRLRSGRWLLRFDGVDDRTAAEALRGTHLLLEARDRPVLDDPDDFYDSDLIGLQARTPDGGVLGQVSDVVHGPAGDYLVVELTGPPAREHLVPFVSEIVPVLDVANGYVVVDPPEGLFEL